MLTGKSTLFYFSSHPMLKELQKLGQEAHRTKEM
jgi:hypothetical protein